ncbi:MAG: hypothetical protein ACI88L_000306 [Candidatus Paceibacteria bacterium]|jgi:hypothetical protein
MKNFLKTFLFIFSIFIIWSGVATAQANENLSVQASFSGNNLPVQVSGSNLVPLAEGTGGVPGTWTVAIFENQSTGNLAAPTITGNLSISPGQLSPVTLATASITPNTAVSQYFIDVLWFSSDGNLYSETGSTTIPNPNYIPPSNDPDPLGTPSISIAPPQIINNQNGETTSVNYTITGENIQPEGNQPLLINIYESPIFSSVSPLFEAIHQANISNGSFTTTPPAWVPLNGVSLPTGNNFVLKAFLGDESSSTTAEVAFITNEVSEVAEVITSTTGGECNDSASGEYCLLEPIGIPGNNLSKVDVSTGFGGYLNTIFQIGVAMAGIFGTLMIVIGGFTYMTTDSFSKKNDGKTQITNAVLGVLLALLSWLLLYTINPGLTSFDLGVNTVGTGVEDTLEPIQVVNGNYCEAIHQAATNAIGEFQTCNAPNTDGGNLACAYSVDTMVEAAIGHDINNDGTIQLNTWNMAAELDTSQDFYRPVAVGNPPISESHSIVQEIIQKAKPGDILISTTTGNMTGHASVCDTNGCSQIISNSSGAAEVQRNFSLTTATQGSGQGVWVSNYPGIKLHLFRHTSCQ